MAFNFQDLNAFRLNEMKKEVYRDKNGRLTDRSKRIEVFLDMDARSQRR